MKPLFATLLVLLGAAWAATLEDARSLLEDAKYPQAARLAYSLNTETGDLFSARALVVNYARLPKDRRTELMAEAEKAAARALERRETAEAHFLLGSAIGYGMADKGVTAAPRVPEVRAHYDAALRLEPNYDDAVFALAQWHFNVPPFLGGRLNEAEKLFARAVELSPKKVSYRLYYAEALLKVSGRNKRRALEQLEAGLRIVPTSEAMREVQERIKKRLESLR